MIITKLLLVVTFIFIGSTEGGDIFRQKRSEDVNLMTLENTVLNLATRSQQHDAQIQALQAKVTALENRLPSPSTQVAFTVRFHDDEAKNGIALGPQQILKFDVVVTNIGGGYNQQTGIFTAPLSGVYSFFLSIMSANAHISTYIAVVKDGQVLDIVYAEGSDDFYDQGSTQVSTYLQSGQQVWARQEGGDAIRGSSYTVFTGYLI